MNSRRLSLDEFVEQLKTDIDAFTAATRAHQQTGTGGFVGDQFEHRAYDDWLNELAAYLEYVELEERALPGLK